MNQTTDLFAQSSWSSIQSLAKCMASGIEVNPISTATCLIKTVSICKNQDGMVAVVCDGAGSAKFSQARFGVFESIQLEKSCSVSV